jgi:hypothetical protein
VFMGFVAILIDVLEVHRQPPIPLSLYKVPHNLLAQLGERADRSWFWLVEPSSR